MWKRPFSDSTADTAGFPVFRVLLGNGTSHCWVDTELLSDLAFRDVFLMNFRFCVCFSG